MSKSMRRNKQEPDYTKEELARRERQALIAKASTLTVGSFVLIMIFVVTIFFSVSANYLVGIGSSVKSWLKENITTEQLINPEKAEDEKLREAADTKDAASTKAEKSKDAAVKKKKASFAQERDRTDYCQISPARSDNRAFKNIFFQRTRKS